MKYILTDEAKQLCLEAEPIYPIASKEQLWSLWSVGLVNEARQPGLTWEKSLRKTRKQYYVENNKLIALIKEFFSTQPETEDNKKRMLSIIQSIEINNKNILESMTRRERVSTPMEDY